MIVNLYIELPNDKSTEDLEQLLGANGYASYDSTWADRYTYRPGEFRTLDEIEADLECK